MDSGVCSQYFSGLEWFTWEHINAKPFSMLCAVQVMEDITL